MLEQICAAADRAAECAEIIGRESSMVSTKAGPKDHPLLWHELANLWCGGLRVLG